MSIRFKIGILALVVTACVSVMALTAIFSVRNLSDEVDLLRTHQIITQLSVVKLSRDMNYLSRLSRDIMLGGDYERDIKAVNDIADKVSNHFDLLYKAADNFETKGLITKAHYDTNDWLNSTKVVLAEFGKNPTEDRHKAYKEYERDITPKAMKARESFEKILQCSEKDFKGGVEVFENTMARSATAVIIVSIIAIVIIVLSFVVILRTILIEIENRRHAEEALSASDKTARALLDGIDNSTYLIDPDGIVLAINATAAKRAGKDANKLVGSCLWDFYLPSGISHKRKQMAAQVIATCRAARFEDERNGLIFDHTYYPVFNDAGAVVKIAVMSIDVTEQKKALKALEESEKRFRTLIEDAPIGISMSRDLRYTYVNRAYTTIFGFNDPSELIGTYIGDRIAPQCRSEITGLVRRCLDGGKVPFEFETIGMRKDGLRFPCYVDITRLTFDDGPMSISFTRDFTERKQAWDLMIQTEKMVMIGGLAAGMAHEINNPVGIIIQNLQNIERRLAVDSPDNQAVADGLGINLPQVGSYLDKRGIFKLLVTIRNAGERTARIVSNMLQFSRKSDSEHKLSDLPLVIERTMEMAANDYDLMKKYNFNSINFVRHFSPDLPQVKVNVTEIEQVMINILKNSAQAMSCYGTPDPEINLSAYREDQMVVVKVADNGPGMDEQTRKRIFEPFFTTKEVGFGTGLGLFVSYTLITQSHKGVFTVDSIPGNGACFTIKLPLD